MARWRLLLGRLLPLFFAVSATLLASEALLRLVTAPPWLYRLDPSEAALLVEDPLLGYALRPGQTQQWTRGQWSIHVQINREGLRDDPLPEARAASWRAVAVGDSFTFGIGVEHGEAWPEVLERLLADRLDRSVAIVNAGIPGYSARQMRQRAVDLLGRVDPALVFFGLYARSYWRVRDPYVMYGGALVHSAELPQLAISTSGDLVVTRLRPGALRELDLWLKGRFQLAARLFDLVAPRVWPRSAVPLVPPDRLQATEEEFQPVRDEIAQLQDLLTERGIPMVILLVSHQEPDGRFAPQEFQYEKYVTSLAGDRGLPLADPLPRFVTESKGRPLFRTPSDIHWTPRAHQIAAEEIVSLLETRHLLVDDR